MKRVLLLLLVGGVARADVVKAPAGWTADQQAAISMAKQIGPLSHFAGSPSLVTATVYRAPTGGSLFITKLGTQKIDDRDRAATAELLEIDASMKRSSTARSEADARAVDNGQLVASRRWIDTSTGVVTDGRIVIAGDAQQLIAVMGECVLAGDAPVEVVTACKTALASLDPGIPAAARVPLAIHAPTVEGSAKPPPAPPEGSAKSGPSLVDSGERPSLPPMQIPQEQKEPDRRPIYVGVGLIFLAVVFYFNRKNREKLEREYEKRTGDKPAPEAKPAKSDRDADDIHAAADDDTKESK